MALLRVKKQLLQQFLSQISITPSNFVFQRSSIYTAELRAILLTLKHVYQSNSTHSLIISDSLSALQSISSRKITHPILEEIHNLLSELAFLWETVVFMWVPSHVGIHGNTLVDKAAKDSLKHDIFTFASSIRFSFGSTSNQTL